MYMRTTKLTNRASAMRSARGHASSARSILTTPGPMTEAERQKVLYHVRGVEAALVVLHEGGAEDGPAEPTGNGVARPKRNPIYFQNNGRYLSDAGRRAMFDLFEGGHSTRAAAAELGISQGPAAEYRRQWLAAKHDEANAG